MNPARRPPAAAHKKRKQSSDITTTAKKRRSPTGYSDDSDEDAPDTPTTAGNSSALLNRIRAVKYGKKIRRTSATVIKDALRAGETDARYSRQVWRSVYSGTDPTLIKLLK